MKNLNHKIALVSVAFGFTFLMMLAVAVPSAHAALPAMSTDERESFEKDLALSGIRLQDAQDLEFTSDGNLLTVHVPESSPLTQQNVLFVGMRLGLMFPYGFEAVYQDQVDGKTRFHADLGITTSNFLHSIEAAGAWHPRDGHAFFAGIRVKDAILFDAERGYGGIFNPDVAEHFFSIGPEIGWQKTFGQKQRVLGTISLGAQKAWGQDYNLPIMPEIRFSLAVKIFKK